MAVRSEKAQSHHLLLPRMEASNTPTPALWASDSHVAPIRRRTSITPVAPVTCTPAWASRRSCMRTHRFRQPECVRPGKSWAMFLHIGPCSCTARSMISSSSSVHMSPCLSSGRAIPAGGSASTVSPDEASDPAASSSSASLASSPSPFPSPRLNLASTGARPELAPRLTMPPRGPRALSLLALILSLCQRLRTASAERPRGRDCAMEVHL
mmetsp:Transcript_30576/g.93584  ORF Transcript_30576/g.93584 Transcript_30576/m.93584 type:complete len:211 (+) Transcript_30576:675-1307(+)